MMKSRARIADHPQHPMLIVIPAGSFIASLVFAIVYIISHSAVWWDATKPLMLVGVIGGLVAAIPGLVDLVAIILRLGATRIGVAHMVLNLIVVALFGWNDYLRWDAARAPTGGAFLGVRLSLIGTGVLAVADCLGWKMMYEYHAAVLEHPEAKDPWEQPLPQVAD